MNQAAAGVQNALGGLAQQAQKQVVDAVAKQAAAEVQSQITGAIFGGGRRK